MWYKRRRRLSLDFRFGFRFRFLFLFEGSLVYSSRIFDPCHLHISYFLTFRGLVGFLVVAYCT